MLNKIGFVKQKDLYYIFKLKLKFKQTHLNQPAQQENEQMRRKKLVITK